MHQKPITLSSFVIRILKPYTRYILGLIVVLIYWGSWVSASPYLLKQIIDHIVLFDGDPLNVWQAVSFWVGAYMATWFSAVIAFRSLDYLELRLYPSVRQDIMNTMIAYLNEHSHHYFQNNFSGSLSNRIVDMQTGVVSIIKKIDEAFANGIVLLVALPLLYVTHPVFALIMMVWMVIFSIISIQFSHKVAELSKTFSISKTALVGYIVDSVSNASTMRFFARNAYEGQHLSHHIEDTVIKDRAMQWFILKMRICWDISFLTAIGALIYFLVEMYGHGLVTIGDFAFILTLTMSIFSGLWQLTSKYVEFSEEVGKCWQALEVLSTPHDIKDNKEALPLKIGQGAIEFKNVSFHYNKGLSIFKNKNIKIAAKEKIGFVGFSGSGKTTFVNLILRLFDVESGCILIDGQRIDQVTQNSLREQISIIPQDPGLFHRSLIDNIRYGSITATDEEVYHAAKHAHCHEFIVALDEGYDTLVGERGIKLSGGQRQRVAIARAMLKQAPILILDEATSALDSVTEQHIQESLDELMIDRTTLVIAHRLSTLLQMDRILVFDQGKIVEDGSHEELIKAGGHFARMWAMQSGGFLPEEISD